MPVCDVDLRGSGAPYRYVWARTERPGHGRMGGDLPRDRGPPERNRGPRRKFDESPWYPPGGGPVDTTVFVETGRQKTTGPTTHPAATSPRMAPLTPWAENPRMATGVAEELTTRLRGNTWPRAVSPARTRPRTAPYLLVPSAHRKGTKDRRPGLAGETRKGRPRGRGEWPATASPADGAFRPCPWETLLALAKEIGQGITNLANGAGGRSGRYEAAPAGGARPTRAVAGDAAAD
jgi:hypothetical protein